MNESLTWVCKAFEELSGSELYEILALRQAVFIVEQNCPYQDADFMDYKAWHILGRAANGDLAAYARILPPGTRFAEYSIGRVITAKAFRGVGLGRELMKQAMAFIFTKFGAQAIRLSGQTHLKDFYESLCYKVDSTIYYEDGIPHLEMLYSL